MRIVQGLNEFVIEAIVVLPDHLHAVWQLPENDSNYSGRWRKIKSYFTRGLLRSGYSLEKNERGEYAVWQKRFWEHTIRDEMRKILRRMSIILIITRSNMCWFHKCKIGPIHLFTDMF